MQRLVELQALVAPAGRRCAQLCAIVHNSAAKKQDRRARWLWRTSKAIDDVKVLSIASYLGRARQPRIISASDPMSNTRELGSYVN